MLCKKCKTTISDKDSICRYCGKKTPRLKNVSFFLMGIFCMCIIFACFGYIYLQINGMLPIEITNEAEKYEQPSVNNAANNEAIDPADNNLQINPAFPTREPLSISKSEAETDEIWNLLSVVYSAAMQYKYETDASIAYITRNGYFYDYDNAQFVDVSTLVSSGFLDTQYENEKILLVYIKPSDFSEYNEIDFGYSSDLRLFVGLETNSGVALYSNGQTGLIFREHFNEIITYYSDIPSDFISPEQDSADFQNAVNTIMSHEMDEEGYDVRLLRTDLRYAVVFISYKSEPTVLYGYLLRRLDDGFKVILRRFEQFSQYIENINNAAGDFNLNMLPPTKISDFELFDSSHYNANAISADMTNKGWISEEDLPVTFLCGTNEFIYLEYASGRKFMGQNNVKNKNWLFSEYETSADALHALSFMAKTPPWLILKQD